MTIKDCIDNVDNTKPNQYTIREKVMWLSFVDETIINDVLKTHEGYDGRYDNFEGYTEDKLSVTLIVPSPYDRLYKAYLKMKIDQENGETTRYNNSAALYNTYLMEYRKYYNKTHLPIGSKNNRQTIPQKHTVGLSDAEYENLKKDLTHILTEYFSNTISHDKVYAVVNEFVQNNIHLLRLSPEEIKSALLEYLEKNPIKIDVPDWAMQPNKPTYTADEVGAYDKQYVDDTVSRINTEQSIVQNMVIGLQKQLMEEAHFRGYLSTNAEIVTMDGTPNDFAYSAESGTMWVYDGSKWINTGNPVPDQLVPASDSTPLMNGEASKGQEEAYARGDHIHPSDETRVSVSDFDVTVSEIIGYVDAESVRLQSIIENLPAIGGSSETILYEDVVNTPRWERQPGLISSMDSAFNTDDFYYVTLKDADGNALPSGQFMLKNSYTDDATVYSTAFTLTNLNIGTATLVENYPVEFVSVGISYELRDAGITSYVQNTDALDISSGFGSIRMVLQGEVIPRNTNLYVYPQYKTDKNVVSYHSTNATSALQGDSTKDIVAYTNLPELNNVGNLLYDSTVLKKGGSGYFSLERNVVIRYNEDYKNSKSYQVFGFGKTLSENTNIASIAFRFNNVNNGMLRNGTKIIISEVK